MEEVLVEQCEYFHGRQVSTRKQATHHTGSNVLILPHKYFRNGSHELFFNPECEIAREGYHVKNTGTSTVPCASDWTSALCFGSEFAGTGTVIHGSQRLAMRIPSRQFLFEWESAPNTALKASTVRRRTSTSTDYLVRRKNMTELHELKCFGHCGSLWCQLLHEWPIFTSRWKIHPIRITKITPTYSLHCILLARQ